MKQKLLIAGLPVIAAIFLMGGVALADSQVSYTNTTSYNAAYTPNIVSAPYIAAPYNGYYNSSAIVNPCGTCGTVAPVVEAPLYNTVATPVVTSPCGGIYDSALTTPIVTNSYLLGGVGVGGYYNGFNGGFGGFGGNGRFNGGDFHGTNRGGHDGHRR
jgi:hypothetical protein